MLKPDDRKNLDSAEDYVRLLESNGRSYFGVPKTKEEVKAMNAAHVLTDQQWEEWDEINRKKRHKLRRFCKFFTENAECTLNQLAVMVEVPYKTLNNRRYDGFLPKGEPRVNHCNWIRHYYNRGEVFTVLEYLLLHGKGVHQAYRKVSLWAYYYEFLKNNFPDECVGGVKNSRKIGEVITSAPY